METLGTIGAVEYRQVPGALEIAGATGTMKAGAMISVAVSGSTETVNIAAGSPPTGSTDDSKDRIIYGRMSFCTSTRLDFKSYTGVVSWTTFGVISVAASGDVSVATRPLELEVSTENGCLVHPPSKDNLGTGTLIGLFSTDI